METTTLQYLHNPYIYLDNMPCPPFDPQMDRFFRFSHMSQNQYTYIQLIDKRTNNTFSSFIHVYHCNNVLTHSLSTKVLDEEMSSLLFLFLLILKQFGSLVFLDMIIQLFQFRSSLKKKRKNQLATFFKIGELIKVSNLLI